MGDGECTLCQFTQISKFTGEYDECIKYIKEHGGTIYTQVDCDEYTDDDGTKADMCYVEGNAYVNRTGWYGVA